MSRCPQASRCSTAQAAPLQSSVETLERFGKPSSLASFVTTTLGTSILPKSPRKFSLLPPRNRTPLGFLSRHSCAARRTSLSSSSMKSAMTGWSVSANSDWSFSTIAANISLDVPLTTMRTLFVRCCLSNCALAFRSKPCASTSARMVFRACSETFGWLLSTRDTVPSEYPLSLAKSLIVNRVTPLPFFCLIL